MYYVLFTYSKGHKERDFRRFRDDEKVIEFLHEHYEKIDIVQIIAAEKSFRLGLIETEEFIKSELVLDDDKDPFPEGKTEEEVKRETEPQSPKEEPSAMEKIGEDIEKEQEEDLTDEEIIKKNKEALKRADGAMAAAKADLEKTTGFIPKPVVEEIKRGYERKEDHKKNWPLCPDCKKNKIAPWNKAGRCSECQQYKKIPKHKLDKADWEMCPECKTRKIAPWNETGRCSYCQGNRGKKKNIS